jgi:predicted transcriptional regulator
MPASLKMLASLKMPASLNTMELQLTPEQEAQLAQIATKAGTNPERLAKDVLVRYLDDEARLLASVEKGIAAAETRQVYRGRGNGRPHRAHVQSLIRARSRAARLTTS